MNWIKEYFKNHPALSVSGIEAEAGIPARTLHNFLNESKPTFPSKHLVKLIKTLSRYGFNYEGWSFQYDPSDNTFIAEKRIPGREATSEEITNYPDAHFEYQVPMYRELIFADSLEIITFMSMDPLDEEE